MSKTKMLVVLAAIVCSFVTASKAALTLYVNPNTDGDWVLHLSGQYTGNDAVFFNNWQNSTVWNGDQGGIVQSLTCDSVEFNFYSDKIINSRIDDAFDIGDGTVIGGTYLKGFATGDWGTVGVALKFDSSFGTSMADFESMVFDDTLILKPSDKGSFATVWNTGTYTQSGLSVVVSTDVVPEPATMALLGLGGLFIRRRRK